MKPLHSAKNSDESGHLSLYGDEAALSCVYRRDATDLSNDGLVSISDAGRHFDVELVELSKWRDKAAKCDTRWKAADCDREGRHDVC